MRPLLVNFFDTLSPRSVYLRFFTPLEHLPHSMIARFTQIDYDQGNRNGRTERN